MPPKQPLRRIVFVALPQTVLLDLAGPWDVFNGVNFFGDLPQAPYSLELLSATEDVRIETAGGMTLVAHRTLHEFRGRIDTLVIPAAFGFDCQASYSASLLRGIRRLAGRSRRVASVCGGAFTLAAAGLLDGRRATTHWRSVGALARQYPGVTVEPDQIFVKDGNVYTSAGVTAGIDLALALVEEDLGREVALSLARDLVMFMRRPGGQAQFSRVLESQVAEREPIRKLIDWVAEHPQKDLRVDSLAEKVHMSARNFARVFTKEVGKTPARFIEQIRVEAARIRLEESDADLEVVASRCGFGSANTMRRSFLRVLGVTPGDYRQRFRSG